MQFIDFYIAAHNAQTCALVDSLLAKMQDYGDVKSWTTHQDGDTLHYSVKGSWAAYSTVSSVSKSKPSTEAGPISLSLEHFEDD
jgi:hypothetical protein